MLWNKKWDKKSKTNPLTLDAAIAWMERQPADKSYAFVDFANCLAAQYNKSIERDYQTLMVSVSYELFSDPYMVAPFDEQLELIAIGWKWDDKHTFGAALARARDIRDRRAANDR